MLTWQGTGGFSVDASVRIAHARFPINTGRPEGTNNRIKVIKRIAYGFHDPDYFALKVKQAFPGHALCT